VPRPLLRLHTGASSPAPESGGEQPGAASWASASSRNRRNQHLSGRKALQGANRQINQGRPRSTESTAGTDCRCTRADKKKQKIGDSTCKMTPRTACRAEVRRRSRDEFAGGWEAPCAARCCCRRRRPTRSDGMEIP
jgi:hypothetical protein